MKKEEEGKCWEEKKYSLAHTKLGSLTSRRSLAGQEIAEIHPEVLPY
jgi:hypothetical protein